MNQPTTKTKFDPGTPFPHEPIHDIPSVELVKELNRRGGHPAALARAILLCARKSQDYNGPEANIHKVDRSGYFPLGLASYAQMLHTKSQRFLSLTKNSLEGREPNFEGLTDTALDIINYAGFFIAAQDEPPVDA